MQVKIVEGITIRNINQMPPTLEGRQSREAPFTLPGFEKEAQSGLYQFRRSTSPSRCLPLQDRHYGIIYVQSGFHVAHKSVWLSY
jgi:hypothetical protein